MVKEWSKKETEVLKRNINDPYKRLQRLLPNRTLIAIIGKKDKLK